MSSIAEARANYVPRTVRVTISLDEEISAKREELIVELAALMKKKPPADARLAKKSDADKVREALRELEEREVASLRVLEFAKLPGRQWAEITAAHPPREGVPSDQDFGYDYTGACLAAARENGVERRGEERIALTAEDWAAIEEIGSGFEIGLICDAVFDLNVMHTARRIARLKKASRLTDDSEESSSSPEPEGSATSD